MERFQFATLSALLAGVVFAGAVLEAIALFTYERIGFALLFRRGRLGLLALPLIIMTGPLILAREAYRLMRETSLGWSALLAGLAVAAAWAIASGHVLLSIIAWVTPQITP
jgi:cytochrome c biogenesis protein CcdA